MKRKQKEFQNRLNEEVKKIDLFIGRGKSFGEIKVVSEIIDNIDMESLRILSDRIREKEKHVVIILATKADNKASFIISVTDDAVRNGNLNAGLLAKDLAKMLNGSGGGRPDFAQGGGKAPDKLEEALRKIREKI